MGQVLAELFKHNSWATLELLDLCEQQADEVLDSRSTGTYGTARDTLIHLVSAERRYASIFRPPETENVNEMMGQTASFAMLRASARESGSVLEEKAASASDNWTVESEYGGEKHILRGSTILIQAIDHATEHRTHVRAILTEQGVEPPNLDGWVYGQETGDRIEPV